MAVPDYQTLMLPLLRTISDGAEHAMADVTETLAREFKLTDEDRRVLLPSGRQPVFENRVGWARTYMKKAALLSAPRRGWIQLTERGRDVLKDSPHRIDLAYLLQFPEFAEFRETRREPEALAAPAVARLEETPDDSMARGYQRMIDELESEVLARVKGCSPAFFERLVVDLLVKMGYGGSLQDAGRSIGRSGDAGIDGVIKQDRLGLDVVYIQAKRWDENAVGRPEIQKFVGALQGRQANKGVFITTSTFSREASDYVERIGSKVVLIGGRDLARLMIEHSVGVSPVATYVVQRIDSDYFNEE